jgi:hypothetical protein
VLHRKSTGIQMDTYTIIKRAGVVKRGIEYILMKIDMGDTDQQRPESRLGRGSGTGLGEGRGPSGSIFRQAPSEN